MMDDYRDMQAAELAKESKDARRYRTLRRIALSKGGLEAFVAMERLDDMRNATDFDSVVDGCDVNWAHLSEIQNAIKGIAS